MAQEFTINSSAIETKINQLLPSQGGYGAGIDFSASTMVIPIIDLTETAEGSGVRQDLQSALSLNTVTSFDVIGGTSTIINTTGYFRIFGSGTLIYASSGSGGTIKITDGTTTKSLYDLRYGAISSGNASTSTNFDFITLVKAGDSITVTTDSRSRFSGCTRQIADLSGNLVNP